MTGLVLDSPAPGVTRLTLSRPPVNALDTGLRTALLDALDRAQDDGTGALVLRATGRIFCAGADLHEKAHLHEKPGPHEEAGARQKAHLHEKTGPHEKPGPPQEAEPGRRPGDRARSDRLVRDLFLALIDSPVPVIGAVGAPALGAGFVLAACCDFLLATDAAWFAMPEVDVGQGGGAAFLRRILPAPVVRRLVLTAERVPASELYRLGAVSELVTGPGLDERAVALATLIARKPRAAVATVRASLPTVEALPLRDGVLVEQAYTARLSASPAGAAARQCFLTRSGNHPRPDNGGHHGQL